MESGNLKKLEPTIQPSLQALLKGPKAVLRKHLRFQQMLVRLARTFISLPLDQIEVSIQSALQEIGQFVGVDRSYILDYDHDNDLLDNPYEWCAPGIDSQKELLQGVPLSAFPEWVESHIRGEVIRIDDVNNIAEGALKDILLEQKIKSLITLPMNSKDRCIGCVGFDAVEHHRIFGKEEIKLLRLFSGMLVNVRERQKMQSALYASERRLNTILKEMPGAVWSVSLPEKDYVYFTPSAEALYQRPLDELTRNSDKPFEFTHPDDVHINQKAMEELHRTGSSEQEYRLVRPNGSHIWVKSKSRFIYDEEKKPIRVHGVDTDITQRKKAEDLLIKAKEEAELASEQKSRFLSIMSHELRTPLTGIIGFADLMRHTPLNDDQKKFLHHISISAKALKEVVGTILDFTKIETGEVTLHEISIDLHTLCLHVIQMVEYQAFKNEVELVLEYDDRIPQKLILDPVKIQQVLLNLVGNAVKFTRKGKVVLRCRWEEAKSSKRLGFLHISVSDTGIGIPEDQLSKIFDSFVQLNVEQNAQYVGSGLGLPICANILKIMRSKMEVKSQPGQGSCFSFSLEMTKDPNFFHGNPVKGETSLQRSDQPITILLVEDYIPSMELVKELILRQLPKAVIFEAVDGKEAVQLYEEHQPDIVLMDLQIPFLDGFEATKTIRNVESQSKRHTPVIAITASVDKGTREKSQACGMDDFIPKPISVSHFQRTLDYWTKIVDHVSRK